MLKLRQVMTSISTVRCCKRTVLRDDRQAAGRSERLTPRAEQQYFVIEEAGNIWVDCVQALMQLGQQGVSSVGIILLHTSLNPNRDEASGFVLRLWRGPNSDRDESFTKRTN